MQKPGAVGLVMDEALFCTWHLGLSSCCYVKHEKAMLSHAH